jgi:hypothetical protein
MVRGSASASPHRRRCAGRLDLRCPNTVRAGDTRTDRHKHLKLRPERTVRSWIRRLPRRARFRCSRSGESGSASGLLDALPVRELPRHSTSYFLARSHSHRREPRKPAPRWQRRDGSGRSWQILRSAFSALVNRASRTLCYRTPDHFNKENAEMYRHCNVRVTVHQRLEQARLLYAIQLANELRRIG